MSDAQNDEGPTGPILTARLQLRRFEPRDEAAFVAMNADPEVRRYFPDIATPDQSRAAMARMTEKWDRIGYAFGAVERRSDGAFLGLAGLSFFGEALPLPGGVEIGWRFRRDAWGQGYATEAAQAWLSHGFDRLGLARILAFTATGNTPSERVMARIGMRREAALDFIHPGFAADSALQPMVVWQALAPARAAG